MGSPSDLPEERTRFPSIISEINTIVAHNANIHLEAIVWEDALRGSGRPQALINEELKTCDIVVLDLWKKWGTSTGKYSSGFEEEYELADQLNTESGRPEIFIFFRGDLNDLNGMVDEQVEKVKSFRNKILLEKRHFPQIYLDIQEWERSLRQQLSQWLNQYSHSYIEAKQANKPFRKIQSVPSNHIREQKPTVFFDERVCMAFPGIRGLHIIEDPNEAISRLSVLLQSPLESEHRSPIWMLFKMGSINIFACQRIDDEHILINNRELSIDKLAIYRSDAYWIHFVYIECQPDKPSGLDPNISEEYLRQMDEDMLPYEEAYARWKHRLLTYEQYCDGAVFENGKSITISGAQLRIRYLTPANIIITSQWSPIHDRSFDRKRREYLDRLLNKQMSLEEFVQIVEQLPRIDRDVFGE